MLQLHLAHPYVLTTSYLTVLVSLSLSVFFQGRIIEARIPSVLSSGFKVKYEGLGRKPCLPVLCFLMILAKQNKKGTFSFNN